MTPPPIPEESRELLEIVEKLRITAHGLALEQAVHMFGADIPRDELDCFAAKIREGMAAALTAAKGVVSEGGYELDDDDLGSHHVWNHKRIDEILEGINGASK